jgi:hypothetical protein
MRQQSTEGALGWATKILKSSLDDRRVALVKRESRQAA